MKLISANIRFDSPKDGPMSWTHRREVMAQNLLSYHPDLIATQEGWRPQLDDLKSLLIGMEMAFQDRPWIKERMYPCIFFNPQTIQIFESGEFWLSETPHVAGSLSFKSSFPRLATWVKAKNCKENFSFMFVSTHLDHVLNSTREEQIKVLLTQMEKINKPKLPCILAGDFNEAPEQRVRALITQYAPRLYDPWLKLGHTEEPSHHYFGPPPVDATRIDWMMVDRKFEAKEIFLDKTQQKGIYPSDHYPVKLEVTFKND